MAREVASCRGDFPSLKREVDGRPLRFLDGPAGTQVPQAVIDAVSGYYRHSNANCGGAFATSRETGQVLEATRAACADLLGVGDSGTVSLGPNMTTLTYALSHALERHFAPGDEVVITQLDHEANRGPWRALERSGIVVKEIAVRPDATLDPDDMARQITAKTRLVAAGGSSNAFGTVNDIARLRDLSRAVGAWLFVDAVHYAPHFPLDVVAWDADFVAASAYKFYGPHVGMLYARAGLLDALSTDRLCTVPATAPDCLETGTPNYAAFAGVTAAIDYLAEFGDGEHRRARLLAAMQRVHTHERAMLLRLAEGLTALPGCAIAGTPADTDPRAPTLAITVDGVHSDRIGAWLGEHGVAVWSGHFYAVRPVEKLGYAERGGVVRIGISMYTSAEDVDAAVAAVAALPRQSR
ncbi:MAG: cysteine desulfurase-like protein [Pseudomonadota bacterium]